MVEIEQRRVRTLEQHGLVLAQRVSTSSDVSVMYGRRRWASCFVACRELLELERRGAVDALEPDILLRQGDLEFLAQDLRVEQILDADSEP